ncbi:MAG: elongation factor P [Pseudomonadota bacterium]
MRTRHIILLTGAAALIAASSGDVFAKDGPILKPLWAAVQGTQALAATPAIEGGPLGTMPHGRYQCALPGDAQGAAIQVLESENFRIAQASSYKNDAGRGIYLMRGKTLTFTRGPKKGERFERVGSNQLQKIDGSGSLSKLICTRLGSSN